MPTGLRIKSVRIIGCIVFVDEYNNDTVQDDDDEDEEGHGDSR